MSSLDIYRITLIRHGQTMANEKNIYGADFPLSPEGWAQASSVSELYRAQGFDKVFCSKLQRTKETAWILFGNTVPSKRQKEVFNEIWFGDVDGCTGAEIKARGVKNSYDGDFIAFLDEIHGDDAYKRGDDAIAYIYRILRMMDIYQSDQTYPNRSAAIVSSDTMIRCIFLNLIHGHSWRKISEIPHVNNLAGIEIQFMEDLDNVASWPIPAGKSITRVNYSIINIRSITEHPGDKEVVDLISDKIFKKG